MHKLLYLITGTVVLTASFGCAIRPQNEVLTSTAVSDRPDAILASFPTKANRPPTKSVTIAVEGEKTPVTLRLYDQYSNLFTTYYPEQDFLPEGVSSGEGTGVRFIANFGGVKNNNAYVSFSFLRSTKNLGQLRNLISGKSGLIESNKWQVVSRTRTAPYRWVKEKIVFKKRQGNQNITGTIYLGQQNNKAFYVVTHYPVEYGDGFSPRAHLILQNLEVGG